MFVIALLYIIIPIFLVLFTFFSSLFVVPSAIALTVVVYCLFKHKSKLRDDCRREFIRYWPLLLAALLLSYLCVVVKFDTYDWSNLFAIFNSLVNNTYPPVIELDGQTWFLRYYVSWFMPPAIVAKFFGSQFLVPAMFVWTAMGIFIAMLLMFHNLSKKRHMFLAIVVFFLFSGLDLVGAYLTNSFGQVNPYWLNWWAGGQLFVMLSNLNILHYAPSHALAAFISTGMFIYNRRMTLQYIVLIATVIAMWSPFCVIGLLPITLWSMPKEDWKIVLTPQNLLAAPLLAIPIVLYLTQETGEIVKMYVWQHANFSFVSFVLFCVLEFLLILGVLYFFLKEERSLITILAIFLTLLCTYRIGMYADLLARGSMPAICIISILIFKSLVSSRGLYREIIIIYMLVGAVPVVAAFVKGVVTPMPKNYRHSTFEQNLVMRPIEDRDQHRNQNLVAVHSARHIGGIPLMRELP